MIYELTLDEKQLRKTAKDIRQYAQEFEQKVKRFFDEIANRGIQVAQMHEGDYSGYIVYSKKFENTDGEYTVSIMASDTEIVRTWYTSSKGDKVKTETISPLLMAEYGSGFKALQDIPEGVNAGQGTLNKYGHAFDTKGWTWWSDSASDQSDATMIGAKNGRWLYRSTGSAPTRPLHNAVMTLIREIEGIAMQVFR